MAHSPVSNKIKVMVVDDEELYSDLLRIGLSQLDQLEVIGVFQNGKSALDAAPQLKPDVAILDIELGTQLNGIQVGIQLRRQLPDIGIVLLSNHGDPQFLSGLPEEVLGEWSYLLKKSASNVVSLARVIEGAADGYVVMDAEISKNINIREGGLLAKLTPRQREILALIAQGLNNEAIAGELHLSEKSVENQINAIYQQTNLKRDDSSMQPRVKAVLMYLEEMFRL